MALDKLFSYFEDQFDEEVTFAGPKDIDDTDQPPRISWVPIEAEHMPPRRVQGPAGDDGPILTRRWTIRVEIWGETLEQAEALADQFLAVSHRLLSQYSYKPGREVWEVGGVTSAGAVCKMLMMLEVPILRLPLPTQSITAIDQEAQIGDVDTVDLVITG